MKVVTEGNKIQLESGGGCGGNTNPIAVFRKIIEIAGDRNACFLGKLEGVNSLTVCPDIMIGWRRNTTTEFFFIVPSEQNEGEYTGRQACLEPEDIFFTSDEITNEEAETFVGIFCSFIRRIMSYQEVKVKIKNAWGTTFVLKKNKPSTKST